MVRFTECFKCWTPSAVCAEGGKWLRVRAFRAQEIMHTAADGPYAEEEALSGLQLQEPAWVNLDDAQIVIVLLMMYKHARKVRFVAQP